MAETQLPDCPASLLHGEKGVIEYVREDGWALRVTLGYDDARMAEILDLRTVEDWYRHYTGPTLAHTPAETRTATPDQVDQFGRAIVSDHLCRHRPIISISRDGVQTFHDRRPELNLPIPPANETPQIEYGPARRPKVGHVPRSTALIAFMVTQAVSLLMFPLLINSGHAPRLGWLIVCAAQGLFACVGLVYLFESTRTHRRRRRNLCVECGYSRGKLPHRAPCPECGAGHWYR